MSILQQAVNMYKIIGRYMDGTQIIGYQLVDSYGMPVNASKADVEKLANEGLIENCRIIEFNGINYIKGVGIRISELPIMNLRAKVNGRYQTNNDNTASLMITKRMMDGNSVIGYVVTDSTGKPYRLSKEKVWQLARERIIGNVMAQLSGKQKILRGIGMELRDLPSIQITGQCK